MRSITALFFIGLISMTMAFNADIQFLKSLKRQTYGKTLLDTVQVQMMSNAEGNGIDIVTQQLNVMEKQTIAEQSADKKDNANFQDQTKVKVSRQSYIIASVAKSVKQDEELIRADNANIKLQQIFLVEQRKTLASKQHELKENIKEQKRTTAVFQQTYAALATQVAGLAKAKGILETLNSGKGNSFLEVQSSISNLKFEHPKYQSMINVLAQLMSADIVSDQDMINRIIKIIDTLTVELRKEIKLLELAYEQRMEDLSSQQLRINTAIEVATGNIDGAEAKIARLQEANVNAQQRIIENTQRSQIAFTERADAIQDGVNRQRKYNRDTSRRTEEIEIITKVIQIFTTRFSQEVRAAVRNL